MPSHPSFEALAPAIRSALSWLGDVRWAPASRRHLIHHAFSRLNQSIRDAGYNRRAKYFLAAL